MTDYSSITGIRFSFAPHPIKTDAHQHLNTAFADTIEDLDPYYINGTTKTGLKANILDMIKTTIVETIESFATQTTDTNKIRHIITAAAFKAESHGHIPIHLRNMRALEKVMKQAIKDSQDTIDITITTSHIFFDPQKAITYLNWDYFATTEFTSTTGPTAPVPAAAATLTTIDIITAVTTAIQAASTSTGGGTHTTGATITPTAVSAHIFNPASLPAEVLKIWEQKKNRQVITSNDIVQFSNGDWHYQDGAERLFLADGTLFLLQPMDEKGLFRAPVFCQDDSHVGIRAWYATFVEYMMDHGFYAHPLWSFRKNHGGDWGCTAGKDTNDDLPLRMDIPLG